MTDCVIYRKLTVSWRNLPLNIKFSGLCSISTSSVDDLSASDWYLTQFIFFMTFVNIYQIFKFLQRLWDILNLKLGIKFYFLNCFQIELLGIEELQTPLRINYVMGAIEHIHYLLVDSFLLECAAYVQETNRIRYRIFFLLKVLSLISCAAVLYWIKPVDPWEIEL